jgi:hypothetical protein
MGWLIQDRLVEFRGIPGLKIETHSASLGAGSGAPGGDGQW